MSHTRAVWLFIPSLTAIRFTMLGTSGLSFATGLLIGLGFLCKYTNAFELVSVVLVLALVPRHRREFKRPGIYFLLGGFVLGLIPPLVWNYQHTWVTLSHLQSRGGLDQ